MNYEAVIFDFDGFLMDSGFDGFQWALEERRKTVERNNWDIELDKLQQGIFHPHHSENIKHRMKEEGVNWNQLKKMEEAVADRKVEMAANGDIQVFQDAKKILEDIDLPMAVVSNAYKNYLELLLTELGIKENIVYWNAPSLENIKGYRERMKPEPEMVEEALEELDTGNAIMIGDQIEDILAARKAGIDSVYIDRSGDKESKADYSIKSLKELPEILKN